MTPANPLPIWCCLRQAEHVAQWQRQLPDWRIHYAPDLAGLLQAEAGVVIVDGGGAQFVRFAGAKEWPLLLARHKVIFADPTPDSERGLAALQTGCVGYCHLHAPAAQWQQVLTVVAAGELWVGRELMQRLLRALPAPASGSGDGWALLTEREQAVATLVLEGCANKEIATRLDITLRTVKSHLTAIFAKLDVRDRLQLAARLRR